MTFYEQCNNRCSLHFNTKWMCKKKIYIFYFFLLKNRLWTFLNRDRIVLKRIERNRKIDFFPHPYCLVRLCCGGGYEFLIPSFPWLVPVSPAEASPFTVSRRWPCPSAARPLYSLLFTAHWSLPCRGWINRLQSWSWSPSPDFQPWRELQRRAVNFVQSLSPTGEGSFSFWRLFKQTCQDFFFFLFFFCF